MDSPRTGRAHADDRPDERQIAGAYLRIAHIYRTGGILHLAAEYFGLVVARFPEYPDLAGRARLWLARCLTRTGHAGAARRNLRAIVRDPGAAEALRCHAGLRLLRLVARTYGADALGETRRILVRRLSVRVNARRLARWARIADRGEPGLPAVRGLVAES